jgi:hypothetical protein
MITFSSRLNHASCSSVDSVAIANLRNKVNVVSRVKTKGANCPRQSLSLHGYVRRSVNCTKHTGVTDRRGFDLIRFQGIVAMGNDGVM